MASPLRPLRHRFAESLRNSTPLREVRAATEKRARALETRVEANDLRLGKYAARADQLKGLIEKQAKELAQLRATTGELQKQLRALARADGLRELDHTRLTGQVGAMEERVGRLEQRAADAPLITDAAGDAQARSLLDEVRAEHEQIRTRMQIVGWYEERLRRVESSLAALYDGDSRHPL